MSFLGGPECSTGSNPLSQFTKHVQDDNSLQRDRLVGRGPGMQESMRSQPMGPGQDAMMDEFAQQRVQLPGMPAESAWKMDSLHQNLPQAVGPDHHWASEFNPGMQGPAIQKSPGFGSADFVNFQHASPAAVERASSPLTANQTGMGFAPRFGGYQPMMGMGMGMGMGMPSQMQMGPNMAEQASQKGKGRLVELDDKQWEEQFAELEQTDRDLDAEANAAIEKELDGLDRQLAEDEMFENGLGIDDWSGFDELNTHSNETPMLGDYLFEQSNPFKDRSDPFAEGVEIMDSGGNLSLASLAFEAAVQKDPMHIEAWVRLGSAQAQNEKEIPALRALEQALKVDPSNLEALMGLAVSYTNEGYEASAYRSLERWVSVKYPQLVTEPLSEPSEAGFTARTQLHQKVTDLFIRAAQISPSGESMDPDVQVGLGVLFYAADEFEKAIDCFETALTSTEHGVVNQRQNLHLLWNRLGATMANSGRSEEAIQAYESALALRPNFVRARYNLGVSCINMGVLPEAAGHLLGALEMHRIDELEGRQKAREIVEGANGGGSVSESEMDRLITQNQSTNLYDTLRRVFTQMGRRDLVDKVHSGMDPRQFRGEFDF